MRKSFAVSLAGAALVAGLASSAQAQSASIQASAVVQQQLTVTANQNLTLGNAFPNVPRTVLPTAAASGAFQLGGQANAEITVNMTLPANLTFAANNLPITFGAGSASWAFTNARAGSTTFNPSSTLTQRLDATTGALWVFIGGSVTATVQPAGTYTGNITLNAAYTGN